MSKNEMEQLQSSRSCQKQKKVEKERTQQKERSERHEDAAQRLMNRQEFLQHTRPSVLSSPHVEVVGWASSEKTLSLAASWAVPCTRHRSHHRTPPPFLFFLITASIQEEKKIKQRKMWSYVKTMGTVKSAKERKRIEPPQRWTHCTNDSPV